MSTTVIIGKHAVRQLLSSDKPIEKMFVLKKSSMSGDIRQLITLAKNQRCPVQWLDAPRFNERFQGDHQGIAAITHNLAMISLKELINEAPPVIIMLDHIEDPHNFGAICRSAEAFGITAICYPKNRNAQLSPTVSKASAGAIERLKLCKVTNLKQSLSQLKAAGYWVYAASSNHGESLQTVNVHSPTVLIVGSESSGISTACASEADGFIHIPLSGRTSSLNVSVATAIIIHTLFPQ